MEGIFDKDGIILNKDFFTPYEGSFTVKNKMKERSRRMGLWGWQKMPDKLKHFKVTAGGVRVPPGCAHTKDGKGWLERLDVQQPDWDLSIPDFIGELRVEQKTAMESITANPVGLGHFSTGTGKGVMIPWLVATLKYKTLVVVPTVQLLDEMCGRFHKHLGVYPQKVGGNGMSKKREAESHKSITIITIQSAANRAAQPDWEDWLKSFDMVLVDECDKSVTTDDRLNFLWMIKPLRFYGFTGTLSLNNIDPQILKIWYGPVTEMRSYNFSPYCLRVHTQFETSRDIDVEREFTFLNNDLLEDEERNLLIAKTVADDIGSLETKKSLVLTNRVEHARVLAELIGKHGVKTITMLGEDGKDEREEAKKIVEESQEGIVLVGSTAILGRGFDLPALQSVHVCYPNRFDSNVVQYVGRVLRRHPGKTFAKVVDYVDPLVPVLASQAKARLRAMRKEYGPGFQFKNLFF